MSEGSVMGSKIKGLYKSMCQDEWDAYTVGIIIAFLSVLMLAWARPWGAVGAIRNWGDWLIFSMGFDPFEKFCATKKRDAIGIPFFSIN